MDGAVVALGPTEVLTATVSLGTGAWRVLSVEAVSLGGWSVGLLSVVGRSVAAVSFSGSLVGLLLGGVVWGSIVTTVGSWVAVWGMNCLLGVGGCVSLLFFDIQRFQELHNPLLGIRFLHVDNRDACGSTEFQDMACKA